MPLVEELGMEEQRARLHIVVGTSRDRLGDSRGLDEIKTGIRIAEAAGNADMVANGYTNLAHSLHMFARLAEARDAWRRSLELGEHFGVSRHLRSGRAEGVSWAYADGRWDEALALAKPLIAAIDVGDRHFTDPSVLAVRGWIMLMRGDTAVADRDTARAAELRDASDVQGRAWGYSIRAATALVLGGREEAEQLSSKLAAIGPPMVAGLGVPFPTLAEVAWVFRDLGRGDELSAAVLDPDPIKSPWSEAARAILQGNLIEAADIIEDIGQPASAAYARLRAAEALGQAALAPRGVPHVYRVESETARWLVINTPAGFERFVRAAGEPAPSSQLPPLDRPLDPAALAQTAAEQGIEIIGPPGTLPSNEKR